MTVHGAHCLPYEELATVLPDEHPLVEITGMTQADALHVLLRQGL